MPSAPWYVPRTWTSSATARQYVGASSWNGMLRDDISRLVTPPKCQVTNFITVADRTGVEVVIPFNFAQVDTDGIWNQNDPTKLTIAPFLDGLYRISCNFAWNPDAGGTTRAIFLYKNGSNFDVLAQTQYRNASFASICSGELWLRLIPGDVLEVYAYQDVGFDGLGMIQPSVLNLQWKSL